MSGHRRLLVVLIAAVALARGWWLRFVQDDAFISFRYARHLAEGLGLVYNPGERVEGYTNFLWTLAMAPATALGIDIVAWSEGLSLASFAAALALTHALARRWHGERAALAALALTALNASFDAYATGGLETMFGIAWVLAAVAALAAGRIVPAALATAAAVMTRMDASLLLLPFWTAALFPSGVRSFRFRPFAQASALLLPLVGGWMLARHAYYGGWVPNTFLIKGDVSPVRGLLYIGLFHLLYGFAAACPALWRALRTRRLVTPAVAAVALWQAYLVLVGGDFMEFRLFLPCFPLLAICTGAALFPDGAGPVAPSSRLVSAALLALAVAGLPWLLPPRLIQTVPDLKAYCAEMADGARTLREILGPDAKDVKLAITCAGVLPYLTELPTLDLPGLNDRDVATDGAPVKPAHAWLGNRPGHCRIATWDQVEAKGVNLLINYAWTVAGDFAVGSVAELNARWPQFHVEIPPGTPVRLVLWPLPGGDRRWAMVYVRPHPAVEAAIRRSRARVLDLR